MVIITALVIVCIILSIIATALAIFNAIELQAMKKSTHTIQYVPADQMPDGSRDPLTDEGFQDISEQTKKVLTKDPFEGL